ncbi:MAG TPA: hypothetical protein VNX65_01815 [Patescibacteria group bacterium]|jgi:hypothetical protein|nr:hypothetical protein [Patescibacteria group bacterium]
MPNTNNLPKLIADFPQFKFKLDDVFKWSPGSQTISYSDIKDLESQWLLAHELAHGLLSHVDYRFDVDLLRQESEAWNYAAQKLSGYYIAPLNEAYIEDCLETYRDWLYKRSICPTCESTGLQIKTNTYNCINCRCLWRVNEARQCGLKRTKLPG